MLELAKKNAAHYGAIRARLARAQAGNFGNYRELGEKTLELKIPVGPGYRVYCTLTNDAIVAVLANTKGPKKSQEADIKAAKKLAAEFWREL